MARLIRELQELLVSALKLNRDPGSLDPDAYLFGGALGLDSVDAVQWICSVERHFGVALSDATLARGGLTTLRALAQRLTDLGVVR